MTAKEIILKSLDENTEDTCRKMDCGEPEEDVTGECCHKCAVEILKEYEAEVRADERNKANLEHKENVRKIIERIKELDNKGYCQDKNEPCPYMDVLERGCTTCIAEKVAEEMNL